MVSSKISISQRYSAVLRWFEKSNPGAVSELDYKNPFELLVAVILSAQCTDKRVNMVTPSLLERYPTPVAMSKATPEEMLVYIKSISYPNNKSRHLIGMSKKLVEEFNSEVPSSIEELQRLPGVGRKTANVIASIVYNSPVIAVDTHVYRVSRRVGLSNKRTVIGVEEDLTANIPENIRAISHHWLILHGRYVCTARKPKCRECGILEYCAYYSGEKG